MLLGSGKQMEGVTTAASDLEDELVYGTSTSCALYSKNVVNGQQNVIYTYNATMSPACARRTCTVRKS